MNKLVLKSPAKVNLYLNLLGKRFDGYHEVETVIQAIDLCDELTLEETADDISISSDDPDLPTEGANLAARAARLLVEKLGINKGVRIFIKKRIPQAAGLGGGSGNAATTLLGLNRLWDLELGPRRLAEFGKSLGTDVPFFVSGEATALCTGRGEDLMGLSSRTIWYCLVVPPIRVSTQDAYSRVHYRSVGLTRPHNDVKMLAHALGEGDLQSIKPLLYNGLEQAAKELAPLLPRVMELMKSLGAEGASMSGSGPCCFSLCHDRKEAVDLADKISSLGEWRTFVARTLQKRRKESGNHRSKGILKGRG